MEDSRPKIKFPPVGTCIYCGSALNLSLEHIIPYALDGNMELPDASCKLCRKITGQFEQVCCRLIYGPLRIRLGMSTRRPKERPTHLKTIKRHVDGKEEVVSVPADEYPRSCVGMQLPLPGIMRGVPPSINVDGVSFVVATEKSDEERFIKPIIPEDQQRLLLATIDPTALCRMLAKIAHSFAVANLGLTAFRHRLPPLILGKEDQTSDTLPYLIGSYPGEPQNEPCAHVLHRERWEINGVGYFSVRIRLFASMNMPSYLVIVGEDLKNQAAAQK